VSVHESPLSSTELGNEPENASAELARALVAASGGTVEGVLLYGSHLHGANPDRHSAHDFVVIVSEYPAFYAALYDAGEIHRPPALMSALARVLAPNVIAFTPEEGTAGIAKCLVISGNDFESAVGERPKDHFILARMVQDVGLVWVQDRATREWIERCLDGARARILSWVGPFLEDPFDAEALGRRMLELCYRGEFRPEARNRAALVFDGQRDHFRKALPPGLEAAVTGGTLTKGPDGLRFVTPHPRSDRRRWRWHFVRSKARTTARWLKHVVTFDNWLPYVTRKVERRTGSKIELTSLERRWPLIFLWPRVVRVLLVRPEREESK
jgi:hypothetical protein